MIELYDYQKKAVDDLSNGKILLGGTGAGKSVTALAYYCKNEAPKNIYIITTAKKRDDLEWNKDASSFGITTVPSGPYGGMKVDSWNNIKKYEKVKNAFFIFDEQRLVGTGAWTKSFWKIAVANRWILLTATPGDKWEDYTAIFVANGFFTNKTQYLQEHMVYTYYGGYPQLQRYVNEQKLEKLRRMVLVEMDYVPHTVRNLHIVPVKYPSKEFKEIATSRMNPDTGEPFQGASDLLYGLRKLTNQDSSRAEAISQVFSKSTRLIVFYNFDYELEILRETFKEATVREWNGHKHEQVPEEESWVYLVQYTAGSEGWNCTTTDTMVFYSLTYSYKAFQQALGRIDRVNTPYRDLHYFILRSGNAIDRAIWNALQNKKDFNERAFLKSLERVES